MKRLLAKASALFILAIFVGSFVSTPPIAVDTETEALAQVQSAYPYLQAVSQSQIATPNTTKILVSEESINARFVGMLSHVKWLISGDATGVEDNEIVRLNKQILSLMDDISEDRREDSDDDDDTSSSLTAGPDGYILISNGGSTSWVATSSLGLTASATPLSNDDVTPDLVLSAGQTDEYCLTYEITGNTWEWQTCGSGGSSFATSSINTSLKLANILTDETGTGALVFAGSPTLTGTLSAANANFSGNVGIGTTTPNQELTLAGDFAFDGNGRRINGHFFGGSFSDYTLFQDSTIGNPTYVSAIPGVGAASSAFGIFSNSDPDNSGVALFQNNDSESGFAGISLFKTGSGIAPNFGIYDASFSRIFTILQSGNVGIGSTSPTNTLSLQRDADVAVSLTAYEDGTFSNFLNFEKSRGTSASPTIVSSSDMLGQLNFSGYTGGAFASGANITVRVDGDPSSGMPSNMRFATASSTGGTIERMRITSTGNIGIGTVAPTERLTVQGNINVSQGNGVIQFGGTRFLYASTTNDSIVFGEFAGSAFTSGTTFNIAFGYEAGRNMSNANGDFMTLVGYQAGYQNTGDHTNIVGFGAGYQNSGDYTSIMGPSAGIANSGDYNNLIGAFAGRNNTGGFNNFIGHSVGFQNTGNYNNAIGYYAGYNNTGSNSDMMGYQAGRYLLASSSVVIGAEALYGSHATNFIAANNVAIGYRAGYTADDGASANILIGYQAADNITTGNNNIIIGYNIDAVTATADNRLNIGNLIFGTGLDGTGTTVSTGNIGIGTTTPAQKLQVFGNIRVGTSGANGCLEDFGGGVISGTCSSDENLKENIEPIEKENRSYLESLAALTPVTYNWNEEATELYSKSGSVENLGLIAQDVETQFPELVSLNDEGYQQVDFRALPFYIIQALKEIWEKLQGQDERLEDLEQENEYLKERIESIEDELNISPAPAPAPAPTPEPVTEESVVETVDEPVVEEEPTVEEVIEEEPVVEEVVLIPGESV